MAMGEKGSPKLIVPLSIVQLGALARAITALD
jgi:hypothetical protein